MADKKRKVKIGIIGCGAIGSRIALSTLKELKDYFRVEALYDINQEKSHVLASQFRRPSVAKVNSEDVYRASDIVVEAVNSSATVQIVRNALKSKKNILVMSLGRLFEKSGSLFSLARKNDVQILVPSGAIAGLDAIKAAGLVGVKRVTLTTTKPTRGFKNTPYLEKKGIDPLKFKKDTVIFDGTVAQAVKAFPLNINVAAILFLALEGKVKLRVRIVASPQIKRNTHEIVCEGKAGRITTRVENDICPDNPKTSYLAVLSAIQALKQYASVVKIGT